MASMAFQIMAVITLLVAAFANQASAHKHFYSFSVENATLTRNCANVTVATINGISPGPPVIVTEGDTVVITVTNNQIYPVTLHWHGIRQFGTNYADGPVYITQCPIQEGGSYIYEFTLDGQRGTFFYHAHIAWLRATVHGAFIIKPKVKPAYGPVEAEFPIILAEWIGINPNVYGNGFLNTVTPAENITTITPTVNGNAGPLYNCFTASSALTQYTLKPNKVYLLRLINAAMNSDYFFRVGGHKVTVVAADANYLKPFRVNVVALTPGQTSDVLLITSKTPGRYYFGFDVGPSPIGIGFPPPRISALGLFTYTNARSNKLVFPTFPSNVTLKPLDEYVAKQKNLYTYTLKKTPDLNLIYTVNLAVTRCVPPEPCFVKIMGAVQNQTFVPPTTTSILQAYANSVSGVYTTDFPDNPPSLNLNTTSTTTAYSIGSRGTKVKVLNYGDVVQVVFQNVFGGTILDHPFHLHGHDFYVVGRGYGVYNPSTDPAKFNLVDPPLFNTYGVPNGGWVAFRFLANNPGVWLVHCHFERHLGWGMEMVFITKNGGGVSLQPPNHPLPSCVV